MKNSSNRLHDILNDASESGNPLETYIQSLSPETLAQLSKPDPEVLQVMERNIVGMLGGLPAEQFEISVTTSREHLGRLLASAMMSGYFLNNAKHRMALDRSFQDMEE
ncbi:MAG: DUF760 domain-containing protein [Cyanobacteriota bacterium]|nr:DUF760 domain-containing protein [Cyanobacteriota bacterium]